MVVIDPILLDWLYTIDDASGVADDRKMTARLSKQQHTHPSVLENKEK